MKRKYLSVFSNLKMKTKLMLLYFPITILSLTVVGILAYVISSNAIEDQSLKIIRQAQNQVCTEISSRISGYENTLKSFCLDTNKNRTLKGNFYQAYDEKLNMESTISNIYSVMASLEIYSNITMVRAKSTGSEAIGKNFHNLLPNMPDATGSMSDTAIQVINLERIQDRPWMETVMKEKNECIWMQIENDEQYGYYSVIKWSSSEVANSYNGFYIMTLRIEDILQIDPVSASQQAYSYLILDENCHLLYSDERESNFYSDYTQEIQEFCLNNQDMMSISDKVLLKGKISENGWTVISLVSLSELSRQTLTIGMVVFISCVCAGVILFMVSMFLAHTFSNRINRICRHMQRFQKGNFDSKIKKVHQDELGYLDSSFNEMVEQMNDLIQKVYQANIDIKEAQLRALQAQINPHFLYNSLSIINRLSDLGCNQEINQMVFSLATFYRMTLNKGRDIIRIEDEIKQIKAYLDIYKIRLEDRFEVVFDFDSRILNCETVKVILQPFVENIFEHALGESEDTIHIKITGKCMPSENKIGEEFIQFVIQDDGIGIEPERLSELVYTDSQNTSGYGIKNVHQRIQMYYGSAYGVKIESELGKGTTVKINIPRKDS